MPSDFTPNNVWGTSAATDVEEELVTPSGQTCRAKKMSIERMIEAGILAEADALTATVTKYTRKVKGANKRPDGEVLDTAKLMTDPEAIKALISVMDKAVPHVVVSPTVRLHYTEQFVGKTKVTKLIPAEDREQGVIYTDQVGFEDKMFLFDWAAGGLGAMLQFRQ